MKRLIFYTSLFFFALLLNSCFELKQSLIFQSDDTCIMSWSYLFPEKYQTALQQCESRFQNSSSKRVPYTIMNKESWQKWVAQNPDLELRGYSLYTIDDQVKVRIVVLCKNAMKNINSGIFGDLQLHKNSLGDVDCQINISKLDPEKFTQNKDLQLLLKDAHMTYTVNTPTALLKTNGKKESFQSASWQWDFAPKTSMPDTDVLQFSW